VRFSTIYVRQFVKTLFKQIHWIKNNNLSRDVSQMPSTGAANGWCW